MEDRLGEPGDFADKVLTVAVISTIVTVSATLPLQLTPKIQLDRATPEEIQLYKHYVPENQPGNPFTPPDFFENESLPGKGGATLWQPLPLERWRYYVLRADGTNQLTEGILKLLNICSPALISNISLLLDKTAAGPQPKGAMMYGGGRRAFPHPDTPIFDMRSADDALECIQHYLSLDTERHEGILRAIDLMYQIERAALDGDFLVVALFSVIEMLITHKPNNKEIGDSLLHQIKTKIPLLSARIPGGIPYPGIQPTDEDTIWDRLYEYRSQVAHGEHVKFDKKQSVLVSREVALDVLAEATRRILRYAMKDPDLVTMLKPV